MAGTAKTRDPRRRAPARVALAVVVGVAAASALTAIGTACLPNLAEISAEPTSIEGAAPFVGCGDGLIATLDDGGDAGESCDPGKANDVDAQAPGCRACQITCDEGTRDPATDHCYFAAGSDSDYTSARTRCDSAGAHVVTFASATEVAIVNGIAGAGAGYWVGLSRSSTLSEAYGPDPSRAEEPGFPYPPAGPCEGCFGLGADGGFFAPEDAAASNPDCLVARGGSWLQVPCRGASRTTICEREPVGTRAQGCIGGYCFTLPSTAGKKSYLVAISAADPDHAAQSCAGLEGGSLVIFGSAEEREQLAHEILERDPTAGELWIGVVQDAGTWSWDDGVPVAAGGARPVPWGNAQPPSGVSGSRAFMRLAATAYDTQLAYADDGGRAPRLYVCQRPSR